MKQFCLFLVLVLLSCNGANNEPAEQLITQDTLQETNRDTLRDEADERSNWQKPELIINSLGNLEGRTLADIGSGALGYFVFKLLGQTEVEKVIAVDIDPDAVEMLNILKDALSEDKSERLDIRLADENDPKLLDEEVDIILIVNTAAYIQDRIAYFTKLLSKLKEGGKIAIVDFKTKRIPDYVEAPPYEERVYLDIIEEELYASGYSNIITNDTSLEFQYFITAEK